MLLPLPENTVAFLFPVSVCAVLLEFFVYVCRCAANYNIYNFFVLEHGVKYNPLYVSFSISYNYYQSACERHSAVRLFLNFYAKFKSVF